MNDLTMTNVWLAILAIVSLIEFVMICAAGFFGYQMYRKAMTTIENVERVHIAPLRARVDRILDEVEIMTGKLKGAQESVSHAFHTAAGAGSLVASVMMAKTRPVLGILNGVRAAASTILKNGSGRDRAPIAMRPRSPEEQLPGEM